MWRWIVPSRSLESAVPRASPAQVTVAIATRDRPERLARCVAAILAGDVLPAQLVVVDQGGDDRVGHVLASLHPGPVRFDHVRQRPLGLAASRNMAIAWARCPIIAFTDDDCVPAPDWVAVGERLSDLSDPHAALSGRVLALGPEAPQTFAVSLREGTTRRDYRSRAVPWEVGTGGNFIAKRRWLHAVGGFDERLGAGAPGKAAEDADLIYRLLRSGATLRYEPDAVVYHERQGRAQRLSSRSSYGYGIGAFCALWLARGEPYAGYLLALWTWRQGRGLLGGLARRDWFFVRQRILGLFGSARGICRGFALALTRGPRTPNPARLEGPPSSSPATHEAP